MNTMKGIELIEGLA